MQALWHGITNAGDLTSDTKHKFLDLYAQRNNLSCSQFQACIPFW
jgi:hypothetical protein